MLYIAYTKVFNGAQYIHIIYVHIWDIKLTGINRDRKSKILPVVRREIEKKCFMKFVKMVCMEE